MVLTGLPIDTVIAMAPALVRLSAASKRRRSDASPGNDGPFMA